MTGTLLLAAVLVQALPSPPAEVSSCVECHRRLDGSGGAAARWRGDVHWAAGLGCPDCHGGDGGALEGAMSATAGFSGVRDGLGWSELCGGCHARPAAASLDRRFDQLLLFQASRHGAVLERGGAAPSCPDCHGGHGVARTDDPASPVHPRRAAGLCGRCHELEGWEPSTGPLDPHARALLADANPRAPSCPQCHGAHDTGTASARHTPALCGRCHPEERRFFDLGPHRTSLALVGAPGCPSCHPPHGRAPDAAGPCAGCHPAGTPAARIGEGILSDLAEAARRAEAAEERVHRAAMAGFDPSAMGRLLLEGRSWAGRAVPALHAVDGARTRELTGMAEEKVLAALALAEDRLLEASLRRAGLVLAAAGLLVGVALLRTKLRTIEGRQAHERLLGGAEPPPSEDVE